jgi:hypothetical protein
MSTAAKPEPVPAVVAPTPPFQTAAETMRAAIADGTFDAKVASGAPVLPSAPPPAKVAEVAPVAETPEAKTAREATEAAAATAAAAAETPEQKAAREATEAAAALAAETPEQKAAREATEAAAAAAPAGEVVELKLPGLTEGDATDKAEIVLDASPAVAKRLQALTAQAARAETVETEAQGAVTQALNERDTFLRDLRADPIALISSTLGDPQSRATVAAVLLADEAVAAIVEPMLASWKADPKDRALSLAKFNEGKKERADAADAWLQTQQFTREFNAIANRHIMAALPKGLAREDAQTLVTDAMGDIQRAITANNEFFFDPKEIPAKLERRIAMWAKLGLPGALPAAVVPAPAVVAPVVPRAKLIEARKQNLATVPVAAASPSANTPAVAAGMNVKESLAALKAQVAAK